MAPDTSENWVTVGQIVGSVFIGIASVFFMIYRKAKGEGHGEDIVQKSVGAAFVDTGAARDLTRIADNTDKLVDMSENREQRSRERELLRQIDERLKHRSTEEAGRSHRSED